MSIRRFEFEDEDPPWKLAPTAFEDFTLLVGVSGVGKTRTLSSLAAACRAGQGRNSGLYSCRWRIEVDTTAGRLAWTASTAQAPPARSVVTHVSIDLDDDSGIDVHGDRRPAPAFIDELVENDAGDVLVQRRDGAITLLGSDRLLRMKETESVVSLFREEETIAPLHQALRRVHRSRSASWSFIPHDPRRLAERTQGIETMEDLRDARLLMAQKAFILQENFPKQFAEVIESYRDIFPQVTRIIVGPLSTLRRGTEEDEHPLGVDLLGVAIAEDGVEGHILWHEMSAGMRRTLQHLLELALAPRGTVILVDEYENSMGVNCLDAVTEELLRPQRQLQLIITSHHPYVINNVPVDHWRVVTRQGSQVRIVPASEVPALDTKSRQDTPALLRSPARAS